MAGTVHTDAYRACLLVLVRARQDAGLFQAELANRLGKPPSFVGKYELGERRLDLVEVLVILKVMAVDAHAFIDAMSSHLPGNLR